MYSRGGPAQPIGTMKALYITDEIDTCDCCGRTDLKATVAMQLNDGGILHYGRTCAARNSGKDQRQIKKEIADNRQARIDDAYSELQETPARKAWYNKRLELYAKYKGRLTGAEWQRMIAPEAEAMEQVIQQIAAKYGIPACCL
jgi:hypothetical protein